MIRKTKSFFYGDSVARTSSTGSPECRNTLSATKGTRGAWQLRSDLATVPMAFEVVDAEETEDYYSLILSFRPESEFTRTNGRQFLLGGIVRRLSGLLADQC